MSDNTESIETSIIGLEVPSNPPFEVPSPEEAKEIWAKFWGPFEEQTGSIRALSQEEAWSLTQAEADEMGHRIVETMRFVAKAQEDPNGDKWPQTFCFSFSGIECDLRIMTWDRTNSNPSYKADDFDHEYTTTVYDDAGNELADHKLSGDISSTQWLAMIALWANSFGIPDQRALGIMVDAYGADHFHRLNFFRSFRPHTWRRWGSLNWFQSQPSD